MFEQIFHTFNNKDGTHVDNPLLIVALFIQYSPKLTYNMLKWLRSLDLAALFYSPEYFTDLGDMAGSLGFVQEAHTCKTLWALSFPPF